MISHPDWPNAIWQRVAVNGIHLEVATFGNGPKLALCLHGFPEMAYSWRYQVGLLVELGFRVWVPNLRGYGNSDSPSDIASYRLEVLVADVRGLIEASQCSQVLLLGHDWGGALAWTLAAQHPTLIHQLVVCNLPHPRCFLREVRRPPQLFLSWYMLFFQLPWLPETLLGANHAQLVAAMIRHSSRKPAMFPDDVLAVYRDNASRPGGLRSMLHWYRALLRKGGWRQFGRMPETSIHIPTLLIWGDQDAALSLRTTDGTDRYVDHLTLRILPGVSHWVQQEAPEQVNSILRAWLTGEPVPDYRAV